VNRTAEDLTSLSPKKLARRLEELAREALPCVAAAVFDGNRTDGLTVGLWVESEGRRDVIDLARVLEVERGGHVTTGWSLLYPDRRHQEWRLLLRVHFERPVKCDFVVRVGVGESAEDELRAALPLLLAASGFAVGFDGFPEEDRPVIWIPAPAARQCVVDVVRAVVPDFERVTS
jgi:hypothetical protein